MRKEFYKITYRDKLVNYKNPFVFECESKILLDVQIKKFIANEYHDIKIYKVVETEELIEEIN